jgi:hypothetical protein
MPPLFRAPPQLQQLLTGSSRYLPLRLAAAGRRWASLRGSAPLSPKAPKQRHRPTPAPAALPMACASDWAAALWTRSRVLATALAALAAAAALALYGQESEGGRVEAVLAVLESGSSPALLEAERDDCLCTVARPHVRSHLLKLLQPQSKLFSVIVGASGTGKSTAVRQAIREINASSADVSGVHFFPASPHIKTFSTSLASSLGFREPVHLITMLRRYLSAPSQAEAAAQRAAEPAVSWELMEPVLLAAARRFKLKHGRPAVLVLDSADVLRRTLPSSCCCREQP